MQLKLEVTYCEDLLASMFPSEDLNEKLLKLWDVFDEEYGLSDAYEDKADWISELVLHPVYELI